MSEPLRQLRQRCHAAVWLRPESRHRGTAFLQRKLRLVWALARDVFRGELTLRAMSLVYATLLAIVPLLAVTFSVLKAFGFHEELRPLLDNFFAPLGDRGTDVASTIVDQVEGVNVSLLGSIGLGLLIYTVVSLMQKIEASFNFVWRVAALRSLPRRVSNYLSVLLVGPALLLGTVGLITSVLSAEWLARIDGFPAVGLLMGGFSQLVPYVLVWLAFFLVYLFVPNARVQLVPAAVGSLLAGIAWQAQGWVFANFIATSTKYTAIYSSFIIPVLVLIWFYLNWVILLLGAQLAFYLQNPRYVTSEEVQLRLSNRLKERLALGVLVLIGANHYRHEPAWTDDELAEQLDLPVGPVQEMLGLLCDGGFVETTGDVKPRHLPARDLDTVSVVELLTAIRSAEENHFVHPGRIPPMAPVDALIDNAQNAAARTMEGTSIRDLVLDHVRSGPTGLDDEQRAEKQPGRDAL